MRVNQIWIKYKFQAWVMSWPLSTRICGICFAANDFWIIGSILFYLSFMFFSIMLFQLCQWVKYSITATFFTSILGACRWWHLCLLLATYNLKTTICTKFVNLRGKIENTRCLFIYLPIYLVTIVSCYYTRPIIYNFFGHRSYTYASLLYCQNNCIMIFPTYQSSLLQHVSYDVYI